MPTPATSINLKQLDAHTPFVRCLGKRRGKIEGASRSLSDLGNYLVISLINYASVGDTADVAEKLLPTGGGSVWEEGTGVDGAQRGHPLAAGVQLPKPYSAVGEP